MVQEKKVCFRALSWQPDMHAVLLCLVLAQTTAPDYDSLTRAYDALRSKSYDLAIREFEAAIHADPSRASTHKDLAYTYLKVGGNDAAREHFRQAMELNPSDSHVALEYAFLSFESNDDPVPSKAIARRIFDRIRKQGDATAEQAFRNIDGPLASGIERWKAALAAAPATSSAHYELAQLAEQRDELELAEAHYLAAWTMLPARKVVLLDLGRVRRNLNRPDDATAALLAASRGGEPRAAEKARELLPERYPYVYEFRGALGLDPSNTELHRELAYLLLSMNQKVDAELEFRKITSSTPDDLLSAAQLGFLYLARKDKAAAMPLLQRVLAGNDAELANRVRVALDLPPDPKSPALAPDSDARVMAERSIKAGYLKDALKYLRIAQESDPVDFNVMLKLGWTYNMLHDDRNAIRWFALARQSDDPAIADEAARAYNALRPALARIRTTAWLFPFYSSRWHDAFGYGQVKTELRLDGIPIRPYVSVRFVGDSGPVPKSLSEKSFILAVGAVSQWHGVTAWGEAGSAISYAGRRAQPDYRGGLSWAHGWGSLMSSESPGWFAETNADEVFVSRFNNDLLTYSQTRAGYTYRPFQFLVNANATIDIQHQYWANFVEAGPGVRFHIPNTPEALLFSVSALRGAYLVNAGNPRRPNFYDLRAGFWYAVTH
ncbi:MAG: Tetratricopeptide domain protein [Bryobacterales bacterium]|nr:Tetratricopeptide domain protein [Bryobacterales bacterium]